MNVDISGLKAIPVLCCVPIAGDQISDEEAELTARMFKAIADPHRVKIINLLANTDGAVCVCDLTGSLGISQATTSFHLKKLTDAGILRREQRGTWAYYSLDQQAMDGLATAVAVRRKRWTATSGKK